MASTTATSVPTHSLQGRNRTTIAATSVPTHSLQRQEHCHYGSNISANTLTAG